MEHSDKTKELVNNIVKKKRTKLRKQDVLWIYKRYIFYVITAIANGYIIKADTTQISLHYGSFRMTIPKKDKKIGIRSGICTYFYFFVIFGGKFKKYNYSYEPTKWMKGKIKNVVDSDRKLEIIPQ